MTHSPDPAVSAAVQKKASASLRALATRCGELEAELSVANEKIASMERERSVSGLVDTMEEKGLLPGMTRSEKVAHVSSVEDLSVVERAVYLAADSGTKIAELADVPSGGGSSEEAFLNFCVGIND